jgi:ribosomal protein S18 acetylase RimI-like enzyme
MDYEFGVLDSSDDSLVWDAAECLAETFTGVQVGDAYIQEPMSLVVQISKEDHQKFTYGYLKSVLDHGFCFIAKDSDTGKVMAVIAVEIYNPDEVLPVFEGNLEPMNKIADFLAVLGNRFKDTVKWKTGSTVKNNQFVHIFMIGVRAEKNKKFVAYELVRMTVKKAEEQGFKGVVCEATNLRCQMMAEPLGFYLPTDKDNQPIETLYATDETFHTIPAEVATRCVVLYKDLDPAYELNR